MTDLPGKIGALVLILCSVSDVSTASEPELLPQPGVLVLRTGRVLRGDIMRIGDRYVVKVGEQDEVGVPADAVALRCRSLQEAYQLKKAGLTPHGPAASHLELGDWCLRYGNLRGAAEQLMEAMRREPDNPANARFEKRLRLAAHPPTTSPSKAPVSRVDLSPYELDHLVQRLPPQTVEQFTTAVQPLLLNRCGTSGCHGPRSTSPFRLMRPSWSRVLPRRFTQQNLSTTLKFLNRMEPRRSPLLLMATRAHGETAVPPVGEKEVDQLKQLVEWVNASTGGADATQPAAINSPPTFLLQPGKTSADLPNSPLTGDVDQTNPPRPSATPRRGSAPQSAATAVAEKTGEETPAPGDPFDPEIFNRKYLHRSR